MSDDEPGFEAEETTLGLLARLVDSLPRDVPVPLVVPLATRIAKLEDDLEEAQYVARWLWQQRPAAGTDAAPDPVVGWEWLKEPPEPTTREQLVNYLVKRGVRRDRAEQWVDTPTSLLSDDVPSDLIVQEGQPRHRATYAARRHARNSDPDYWA